MMLLGMLRGILKTYIVFTLENHHMTRKEMFPPLQVKGKLVLSSTSLERKRKKWS